MKRIFFILLFTHCCWIFVNGQDYSFYKDVLFNLTSDCGNYKSANFIEQQSYNNWDLTYNRLELTIDPGKVYIKGNVQFNFTSLTNDLSSIQIDLSSSLKINSVSIDGASANYKHQGNQVQITLMQNLMKGQTGSFVVDYEGIPSETGFGSFMQNFHSDNIPSLETLSEPYGAMEWWPCKQSLLDKIDSIDIIVHSPEKYETASNGLLIENTVKNGIRTCFWSHRHPIATYLVFFTTTTYEKYFEEATLADGTKVPIYEYVYPEYLETAKSRSHVTAGMIEFYSQLFIDYPFKNEKYGHAQFGWKGGMEHQTMSSMGGLNVDLIAHELAHQWFGDYITCASWKDIWLNEGFATFLTGLYYNMMDSEPWWRIWREKVIEKATSLPNGSVYVDDTTDISRIFSSVYSYNKGAYVLHMLRGQLGDEKFFSGMKKYLNDPRVSNGFATTQLFRENMEEAADTSLTEFFQDWIYGEGYPTYNIQCYYTGPDLSVQIQQSQSSTESPFFEMKVPISVYSKGERKMLWLANTKANETFQLMLEETPDSVLIDEELWLLAKINRNVNAVPYVQTKNLKLYYNAFRRKLIITQSSIENANISIYYLDGKKVDDYVWHKDQPEIDVGFLNTGLYILTFRSDSISVATRFTVNE